MTGLLVSVRNGREARTALAGGATLVDVKEPRRGALGAADGKTWQDVARAVDGQVPLSAALGELLDAESTPFDDLQGFAFAKVGLAGCNRLRDWSDRWSALLDQLPVEVQPVAVVYADQERAHSPPAQEIIRQAAMLDCAAVLIDTYDKQAGSLLQSLTWTDLKELVSQIRWHGLRVVLAGSLDRQGISQVLSLLPDFVAVRGAACRTNRSGAVDQRLIQELSAVISQSPSIT